MTLSRIPLFEVSAFVYSIPNWEEKKTKLINMLDSVEYQWHRCSTDFFLFDGRAEYFDEWYSILEDDLNYILPNLQLPFLPKEYWQLWSQQYKNQEYHGPHNHGNAVLSAVLYLDLHYAEHQGTTFYSPFVDPFSGAIADVTANVKEGDIVFFPGSLLHESRASLSDKVRKIISFNIPIKLFDAPIDK